MLGLISKVPKFSIITLWYCDFSSFLGSQILNNVQNLMKQPEDTRLQGMQVAVYHQQIKMRKISSRTVMIST
jgi:hypothetical protein